MVDLVVLGEGRPPQNANFEKSGRKKHILFYSINVVDGKTHMN
jgi:hypothetical protein